MKNIFLAFTVIIMLLGCSGSDTYRGKWKALSPTGEKVEITFDANKFTIRTGSKPPETFTYKQNSINIENSVETYGIQTEDGRSYQITFPIADNENVGLIKNENGDPMFSISRTEYIKYDELFDVK